MLPISPIIVCSILLETSRQPYMSSTSIKTTGQRVFLADAYHHTNFNAYRVANMCFQVKILVVLTLPTMPIGLVFFFVPWTWFHDRKTDGTWPMPKKLIKGSKCLRSTSRWDHLASWRSPAVCRWAKCLGCCRSDMEDGERWGQNGKTGGKDFGKDLSQGC